MFQTLVPGEMVVSAHVKLKKNIYKSDEEILILIEENLKMECPS